MTRREMNAIKKKHDTGITHYVFFSARWISQEEDHWRVAKADKRDHVEHTTETKRLDDKTAERRACEEKERRTFRGRTPPL